MAQLTGGTFKYTRRIKPGDPNEYNAPFREATAEISWSASEDEAVPSALAMVDLVRKQTVEQVNKMLGKAEETPAASHTYETPQVLLKVVCDPAYKTTRMQPKGAALSGPLAEEQKKAVEPAVAAVAATADTDGLLDDPNVAVQKDITTAELVEAVTRKNAERLARPEGAMLNGVDARSSLVLRELVGKFVQPPKTSRDIPQDLRATFLAQLKAL